jgi:uncharacterized protein (DUF1697 family)
MTTYLALLRGINVGGNNMIKMAELKICLEKAGLQDVKTYIQSGNVLFKSDKNDAQALSQLVEKAIEAQWQIPVRVVVYTKDRWVKVVKNAPKTWGENAEWKHNMLVMLEPYDMKTVMSGLGEPIAELETMKAGDGVVYQSVSFKSFGRTRASKMIGTPVYKQMTIRNYNTSIKLAHLLEAL